jgi:hypothetical protein
MVTYRCDNCFKVFDKKSNFKAHLERKNKCSPLEDSSENDNKNFSTQLHTNQGNFHTIPQNYSLIPQNFHTIPHNFHTNENLQQPLSNDLIKEKLLDLTCAYCDKKFTRKDAVIRHMKNFCVQVKKIENEKDVIMQKLLDKMIVIEKQNESLQKEIKEIKNNNSTSTNTNNTSNTSNTNINNINNGNINNGIVNNIDNKQNIILVGYNKEDLSKIDIQKFVKLLKRGFQAPIELTKAVHFNPELPEYHNIYIPKMNEKYALCYTNNYWKVFDKDELAEDIYENKRAYIIDKWEDFADQLTDMQKKALKRWLQSNDDKDIKILKDDIKKVLYENRHLAIKAKKNMEDNQKKLQSLYDDTNIQKIEKKIYIPKKE